MEPDAKFWDGIAEKYAKSPIRDMEGYQASLDRTRGYLKPTDHVLELGCGTGSTALLLAQNVQQITATDFSTAMIGIANRKAAEEGIENVSFLGIDPFDPQLTTETYDVVMGLNFYHLLDDMGAGFRRSHDLLKPGGLLIAKTPSLGSTAFFKRVALRAAVRVMQVFKKAPFVDFVRIEEVEKAVVDAGFEILETDNVGGTVPRSYLVARKI